MNSIEAQKRLTDRELIIFNSELDRKRKSTATAYILYFLLGTIGGHKFYMGKPLTGFFYIILLSLGFLFMLGGFASAFDTTAIAEDVSAVFAVGFLPLGLLSIMMLIDLFTIPGQIKKQEERVRNDLLVRLVSN
ncbi:TM2 domain-containing protein [Phormidium tenue FACHB-886]|nr:TM2 domain-containing protein [Phormidium tenue FACHB-886]